jgi:hypothetical protein
MYVSEDTFVHLREAADERQRRELEFRRVARERQAGATPSTTRGLRKLVRRLRRSPRPTPRRLSHP